MEKLFCFTQQSHQPSCRNPCSLLTRTFLLEQPTVYSLCYPNPTPFARNPSNETLDITAGTLAVMPSHKDGKRSSST